MKKFITILLTIAMMTFSAVPAFAYVDPSVTTMAVSAIGILILVVVIVLIVFAILKKSKKKKKKYNDEDW